MAWVTRGGPVSVSTDGLAQTVAGTVQAAAKRAQANVVDVFPRRMDCLKLRLTRLPEDMNEANASAQTWEGQDSLTFLSKAMDNSERVQ
jgi:hypothetical protein